MLSKIKGSHWYTKNAQLQDYLENEWLNCKLVSVSHLFKNSMSSNGIVIGYHSSGLTYIDNVSTTVLTQEQFYRIFQHCPQKPLSYPS